MVQTDWDAWIQNQALEFFRIGWLLGLLRFPQLPQSPPKSDRLMSALRALDRKLKAGTKKGLPEILTPAGNQLLQTELLFGGHDSSPRAGAALFDKTMAFVEVHLVDMSLLGAPNIARWPRWAANLNFAQVHFRVVADTLRGGGSSDVAEFEKFFSEMTTALEGDKLLPRACPDLAPVIARLVELTVQPSCAEKFDRLSNAIGEFGSAVDHMETA